MLSDELEIIKKVNNQIDQMLEIVGIVWYIHLIQMLSTGQGTGSELAQAWAGLGGHS